MHTKIRYCKCIPYGENFLYFHNCTVALNQCIRCTLPFRSKIIYKIIDTLNSMKNGGRLDIRNPAEWEAGGRIATIFR